MMLEPHVLNAISIRIIDSMASAARVAMFVKNEVDKCLVKQTNMEYRYKRIVEAVEKTRHSPSRHGSIRSASQPTDISDKEETNSQAYSNFRLTEDQESSERRIKSHKERGKHGFDRPYCRLSRSPLAKVSSVETSTSGVKAIVPINQQYGAAFNYKSINSFKSRTDTTKISPSRFTG